MQTKKIRIAMIGLPGMLIDILAAAFVNEAGVDVNEFEGSLERTEPEIYDDCNLIITSMDTDRLVTSVSRNILMANPGVLILNLSEKGDTGDLIGFCQVRRSLGEIFPEKILQAVRTGFASFGHSLQ